MPLPTTYFQTPDGAITLYHGDCRETPPFRSPPKLPSRPMGL